MAEAGPLAKRVFSENVLKLLSIDKDLPESDSDEDSPRIERARPTDRSNPLEEYIGKEFNKRFRLSPETFLYLLNELDYKMEFANDRNEPISPLLRLSITLRFYATGSFQFLMAELLTCSQASVCNIIWQVTKLICTMFQNVIYLPRNRDEVNLKCAGFHRIANFRGVWGAIDGTHINILKPTGLAEPEIYRNRHHNFSINVQAICDADLYFLDIVARWPGSCHDSYIFDNSTIKQKMLNGFADGNVLLGDSGYSCTKKVLTPFRQINRGCNENCAATCSGVHLDMGPQNIRQAKANYNVAHIRTRNTIERCFGILKRRFPCIHFTMRMRLERNLQVIAACCILHNICRRMNEDLEEVIDPELVDLFLQVDAKRIAKEKKLTYSQRQMSLPHYPGDELEGANYRQHIVETFFLN